MWPCSKLCVIFGPLDLKCSNSLNFNIFYILAWPYKKQKKIIGGHGVILGARQKWNPKTISPHFSNFSKDGTYIKNECILGYIRIPIFSSIGPLLRLGRHFKEKRLPFLGEILWPWIQLEITLDRLNLKVWVPRTWKFAIWGQRIRGRADSPTPGNSRVFLFSNLNHSCVYVLSTCFGLICCWVSL